MTSSAFVRALVLACTIASSFAFADFVTMKNGDRLTGKVIKVEGDTLTLKSELAGEVKIPFEAITSIQSGEPLSLVLKDGQTIVGSLQAQASDYVVKTADAGTVTTAKDKVAAIRSQEEQTRYLARIDRLTNPRLTDLWTGFFDAGYSMTRGNAETNTFNLGASATRATTRDKIVVAFTSVNSNAKVNGVSAMTANAIRGGIRYNVNLTPKLFAFGLTDLEFDEFQQLDLRFVLGGGGGWHVRQSKTTLFDVFGGFNLNKEYFSTGLQRSSGEITVGEELNTKIRPYMQLTERLVFYPNVTNSGNYRVNFDANLITNLNKWLAWNVGFSNRYLSNPVPGNKTNDLVFTTGVRVTFAKTVE